MHKKCLIKTLPYRLSFKIVFPLLNTCFKHYVKQLIVIDVVARHFAFLVLRLPGLSAEQEPGSSPRHSCYGGRTSVCWTSRPARQQVIWGFPQRGVSPNVWFIWENLIKMDDLGVPMGTPINGKPVNLDAFRIFSELWCKFWSETSKSLINTSVRC